MLLSLGRRLLRERTAADLAAQHRGDVGLEQFQGRTMFGVGQAVPVGGDVQHLVAELLVVAVHLLDDLLRAADQRGAALDRVLQGGKHDLHTMLPLHGKAGFEDRPVFLDRLL